MLSISRSTGNIKRHAGNLLLFRRKSIDKYKGVC